MLFVGPMDLSTNIGKFGQFEDPLFIKTIHEAKDKIFKSAKFSGIIPFGKYDWKDVFEMGFDLTTAGTELSLLRDSSRKIIKEFRN